LKTITLRGWKMGGRGQRLVKQNKPSKENEEITQAVEYYVSGEGMWINNAIRRGEQFNDEDKAYLKALDMAANGTIKDDTLYRSVDASAVFGKMTDFDYDNLRSTIVYGGVGKGKYAEQLAEKARETINNAIGKEITEKGFLSTTSSKEVAMDWGGFSGSEKPIVIKFTETKGMKGNDISNIGDKGMDDSEKQYERLLARGTKYMPVRVYTESGQVVVEARIIK